jgi:L-malate glycosyltransferase
MKKILFLTGMRSRKFGAIEKYFLNLCRLMKQNGYKSVFQYEKIPASLEYKENLNKLNAEIVAVSINQSYYSAFTNCCMIVRQFKPDIIVSNFEKTVFFGGFAATIFRVPKKIAIVREIYQMKVTSFLRKTGYHMYDSILCVSDAAKKEIIKGGVSDKKVFTHYMGIFGDRESSEAIRLTQKEKYHIPKSAIVLACIAFDKPIKGIDLLIEAFGLIHAMVPDLYLFIIGVDPLSSDKVALTEKIGVGKRVCWPGIVDNAWELLNIADLYIQPSRNEGLPSAIIEAMAFKKPVMGTPVGGIRELVIPYKTGLLAKETTPAAIAETILEMIEKREDWKKFGDNGHNLYREFFRGEITSKRLVEKYLL